MGKKSNNGYTVTDMEQYAPKGWGEDQATDDAPYEYTLGSGSKILVKRIAIEEIFRLGLLDKLDFFTKSLAEDDKEKVVKSGEMPSNFLSSLSKNFDKMEDTIDIILLNAVVAPVVLPNIPEPNRKKGAIYLDTIPFMDKMDIFGEVLDTEGLSDFREGQETDLGDVPADESVQDAPV